MKNEIERKFLTQSDAWKTLAEPVLLVQGYLSADPEKVVRLRIEADKAFLTIKGKAQGASRNEWEYAIPLADAKAMLNHLCDPATLISKYRRRIPYQGMLWEVDEFLDLNEGLVVAEIELTAEDQPFEKPAWIGEDITDDHRYANNSLSRKPYTQW